VDDDREEQIAAERGEREDEGVVRGAELGHEEQKPRRRHERAEVVRRPPPPRVQASPDEAPPDEDGDGGLPAAQLGVVAGREHENNGHAKGEAGDGERQQRSAQTDFPLRETGGGHAPGSSPTATRVSRGDHTPGPGARLRRGVTAYQLRQPTQPRSGYGTPERCID
jgi:hypothetical protein